MSQSECEEEDTKKSLEVEEVEWDGQKEIDRKWEKEKKKVLKVKNAGNKRKLNSTAAKRRGD